MWRSAPGPRRTASSSGRTAPRGSPTVASTRSSESIRGRGESAAIACRRAPATRTSTPRRSTGAASSGSRARAASTGDSTPRLDACASSKHPVARVHTGSRRHLRARCITHRWQAATSAGSTSAPAARRCCARRRAARARAGHGRIPAGASGSANGTPARSGCTSRARVAGASGAWRSWRLPGGSPHAYAVYVDEKDMVWLSDFGVNAVLRFDPKTARFTQIRLRAPDAAVRQLLGRTGEVWGAESGADKLVVVR